jgi:hypothetical protein
MSNILDLLFGKEYADAIFNKKAEAEPAPELLNKQVIGQIVCRACGTDIGPGEEHGEHLKCTNCDAPIYNPYSEEPRKIEYPEEK